MKGYQYVAISTDNYNHSIKIVQEHSTDKKLQNIPVKIQLKKLQISLPQLRVRPLSYLSSNLHSFNFLNYWSSSQCLLKAPKQSSRAHRLTYYY